MNDVHRAALAYVRAGISVIPIATDGTKAPASRLLPEVDEGGRFHRSWLPYRSRLPTPAELERWFGAGQAGIAAVCGAVSGNLELIDFDEPGLYEPFAEVVRDEAPGLLERLTRVSTPAGLHLWYRSAVPVAGNTKLARDPAKRPKDTLLETRGEGGYALLPGSPAACHPTGRKYEHAGGPPFSALAVLTAAEREVLWRSARAFDLAPPPAGEYRGGEGGRPGDHFDLAGPPWADILVPHGWALAWTRGGVEYWRRPGKDRGCSATAGAVRGGQGEPLLHVFTSSAAPLEPGKNYGRFRALALLAHGGDLGAAARALAAAGFGERGAPRRKATLPPHLAEAVEELVLDVLERELPGILKRFVERVGHGTG